jgi:hypothetical protein
LFHHPSVIAGLREALDSFTHAPEETMMVLCFMVDWCYVWIIMISDVMMWSSTLADACGQPQIFKFEWLLFSPVFSFSLCVNFTRNRGISKKNTKEMFRCLSKSETPI